MVILIAAFNGIESMVERLYSDFDAPITIRSAQGKTFLEESLSVSKIAKFEGVKTVSKAVEETVILNAEKKFQNAQLIGVEESFLKTCKLNQHLFEGYGYFNENGKETAIIGAGLLDNLEQSISGLEGSANLRLYTPLRDASISRRKSPFQIAPLSVVGRLNYNKEINQEVVLTSLNFARKQLNYETDLTAYYIDLKKDVDPFELKLKMQNALGNKFIVKTAAEKNELIFKTSKSEKRIVIIILIFIFILAGFNLIASLNMLYIEKKDNIDTMYRFGAKKRTIFNIFFYEGLLISARGIIFGLLLGITICLVQMKFKLLTMPNAANQAFPIKFNWVDGFLILFLVSALSALCSFFPVYYLVYHKQKVLKRT